MVIPAKAGIYALDLSWIPAFAGMTSLVRHYFFRVIPMPQKGAMSLASDTL